MTDTYNQDAVIGIIIAVAFYKEGFTDQTRYEDITEPEDWENIITVAEYYCEHCGLTGIKITKTDVCNAMWGNGFEDE